MGCICTSFFYVTEVRGVAAADSQKGMKKDGWSNRS